MDLSSIDNDVNVKDLANDLSFDENNTSIICANCRIDVLANKILASTRISIRSGIRQSIRRASNDLQPICINDIFMFGASLSNTSLKIHRNFSSSGLLVLINMIAICQ